MVEWMGDALSLISLVELGWTELELINAFFVDPDICFEKVRFQTTYVSKSVYMIN